MKIRNETLKKLTNAEALDLGLMSIGCMFVRGTAKQRVKGYKTTYKSADAMHYENENVRIELIALASKTYYEGELMQDWCLRVFDMNKMEYIKFVQPLFAINFVK